MFIRQVSFLFICGSKNKRPGLAPAYCTCTHCAGLESNINNAIRKIFSTKPVCGSCYCLHLSMSRRIFQCFGEIMSSGDNNILADDYGTYRNFLLSNAFRASARAALIHSSLLKAILMNLISKSMKKTWYGLFKSNIFLNDESGYCRDRKLKFAPLTIPAIYPNLTAMFFHKFLAEQQTQSCSFFFC